jgi:asparagine synthetase B (glutamine-hydrolysing)
LGGYHYYGLIDRLLPLLRWNPSIKRTVARLLRAVPLHSARIFAGALKSQNAVELFNFMRSVGKDYPRLVHDDIAQSTSSSEDWFEQHASEFAPGLTGAETGMRLDAGLTLPDLFLQKVDVATMAFSLETRCPMTDYRLVEWAMRLPMRYKYHNGETKYLLKKVLCKYLPPDRVYRPKMGFGVPIAEWLRGPLREWAKALIYDDSLMSSVPLDKSRVRDMLRRQLSGEQESHPLLWSVLMLLCFMKRHETRDRLPAAAFMAVA